jgi:arsenical pump membrane protein
MVDSIAATWGIAAAATGGVIMRPWKLPEATWAVAGAVLLVAAGLLAPIDALHGVEKGADVYLFLIGMMLLAELARQQGLFDWLAAKAARRAKGNARSLFALIYLVGTIVTVFLSNDATAVVLTPAVAAVARTVNAEQPLPYLLICAFIANAASFVLPISNPANLVIYGSHMPPLLQWLPRFALPSLLSIAATFVALRLTQSKALRQTIETEAETPPLSIGGKVAAAGIFATALALMVASAMDWQLGLPTCIAGALTAASVLIAARTRPWHVLRCISWGVLPLVAGLFVLVEALDKTGLIAIMTHTLQVAARQSETQTALGAGALLAIVCNLMNNLPAGLIAGTAVQSAHVSPQIAGAVLIGVDIGPNLSVTGSLATILWLSALRRDGHDVGAWTFLKLGVLVMPPALAVSLGGLLASQFLPSLITQVRNALP